MTIISIIQIVIGFIGLVLIAIPFSYMAPKVYIDVNVIGTMNMILHQILVPNLLRANSLDKNVLYYDKLLYITNCNGLITFNEDKFPLIVTHKHCARVLMKHLLKVDDDDFENFDIPSKNIIYIELNDDLTYKNHSYIEY